MIKWLFSVKAIDFPKISRFQWLIFSEGLSLDLHRSGPGRHGVGRLHLLGGAHGDGAGARSFDWERWDSMDFLWIIYG